MDVQITIPQLYDGTTFYKLYIYCSRNAQDIDTIAKVRSRHPDIIIDEASFDRSSQYFQTINGKDCYVIPANIFGKVNFNVAGVSWFNSGIDLLPVSQYETVIDVFQINPYTYTSKVTLNNIYTSELGTMLYYSVIGVNDANNQATHLSKVAGVRTKFNLSEDAQRELSYCDDYTGKDDDVWKVITVLDWDEPVVIGNLADKEQYDRFGCPFVTTVPIFPKDDMSVSLKPLNTRGCILLSFPNPWQRKNPAYNNRKLKAFRFINMSNGAKSEPSEPTYQSSLPLVIEKACVLVETGASNPNSDIPIPYGLVDAPGSNITVHEVIRKDGIYYNAEEHRKLGFNKFNIPMDEMSAIFSETSTQDEIKMEIDAHPGTAYKITVYLFDVYGNVSAPSTTFVYV